MARLNVPAGISLGSHNMRLRYEPLSLLDDYLTISLLAILEVIRRRRFSGWRSD